MKKIIGLAGLKGSGKDTTANILKNIYPNAKVIAFADPLKEALLVFFSQWGITQEHLYGVSYLRNTEVPLFSPKTGKKITLRYALQTLGTQWGRELISTSIWEKITINRANKLLENKEADVVIISDIRFINEAKAVKENNGEIWFIERQQKEQELPFWKKFWKKIKTFFKKEHSSETEMKSKKFQKLIDKRINNNRTLEELERTLKCLMFTMK